MTDRKLRYIERKQLAESGTLGDLDHDQASREFRNALWYLLFEPMSTARRNYINAVEREGRRYFGWGPDITATTFIASADVDNLLSLIEIAADKTGAYASNTSMGNPHFVQVLSSFEVEVNHTCERHRFGYRLDNGEIHKIGSPLLDAEVVGPTLLAVRRPGWEQVERSFQEALDHQRGGETDDALTAAHAAVEASLKAVGLTGQFSTMTKQFRNSTLVPPYLREAPEALESLLTLLGKSNALRSADGDAHGKPPGATDVPQELADLAIHWAGAFILYLAVTTG